MGVSIRPQLHRYHGSGPRRLLARKSGFGYPIAGIDKPKRQGTLDEQSKHAIAVCSSRERINERPRGRPASRGDEKRAAE